MAIKVRINNRSAQISMSGPFKFDEHQNFKDAYLPLLDNTEIHEIKVEMNKVNYMDCSALGMLLLLKERAKASNKKVVLQTASATVSQILNAANFGRIFDVEHSALFNLESKKSLRKHGKPWLGACMS